jgi:hypothetical protein
LQNHKSQRRRTPLQRLITASLMNDAIKVNERVTIINYVDQKTIIHKFTKFSWETKLHKNYCDGKNFSRDAMLAIYFEYIISVSNISRLSSKSGITFIVSIIIVLEQNVLNNARVHTQLVIRQLNLHDLLQIHMEFMDWKGPTHVSYTYLQDNRQFGAGP